MGGFCLSGETPETPKSKLMKGMNIIMNKRNNRIWLRVSDEELEKVNNSSKKAGYSRGAYLRSIALKVVPREKPDEEFYAFMRMLSGLANNINQLVRHANKYDSDIARILYNQADEWGRLQVEIREKFLLPEEI